MSQAGLLPRLQGMRKEMGMDSDIDKLSQIIIDQAIIAPNDLRAFSPGSGFPDEATEGPCQWFNASVFAARSQRKI